MKGHDSMNTIIYIIYQSTLKENHGREQPLSGDNKISKRRLRRVRKGRFFMLSIKHNIMKRASASERYMNRGAIERMSMDGIISQLALSQISLTSGQWH